MTVESILKHKGGDVVTVRPEDSIEATASLLHSRRIGAVIVKDEAGAVVGVLSERDIVRGIAQGGAGALSRQVKELMSGNVVSCRLHDSIIEVMGRMTDRRIRHLPVIEDGRLVGMISIGDVVKRRIDEALLEADELRRYIATG
ncbi:CBS domain-containing protein [Zavarzinia compransoris]|uniref:Inosine-5-monophosphate dehydrogenase n=1 Tax=Zavarzinia compransoris TaxID=1264899 RepID=A0A317E1H5_9PROT|nr:CBS domain-containing protein [Zavarzinia compransoris]PWR20462.1 inosine-5-monophosphate dehydrogenase [Zavarzinia compransoris]TDP43895.1 CBS domain protein [Zavarzinia compransoris]